MMLEIIREVAENALPDGWVWVTSAAAIDDEESAMGSDATFDEVMRRVRAGDGAAETALFQQYVRRLIVLAARQFDASLRDRADVELVVLSACKSFFLRNRRGEFQGDGNRDAINIADLRSMFEESVRAILSYRPSFGLPSVVGPRDEPCVPGLTA